MFRSDELSRMKRTQEAAMGHECTVAAYSVNASGAVEYGTAVTTVCGFDASATAGQRFGSAWEMIEASAVMRFPLSVTVGMKDRVTLKKAYGAVLNPERAFEVCGFVDGYGPSGKVCAVREVYS